VRGPESRRAAAGSQAVAHHGTRSTDEVTKSQVGRTNERDRRFVLPDEIPSHRRSVAAPRVRHVEKRVSDAERQKRPARHRRRVAGLGRRAAQDVPHGPVEKDGASPVQRRDLTLQERRLESQSRKTGGGQRVVV
jgi:hypothetical protein